MLDLSDPILDGVFRALANPGRRSMVDRLTRGPATLSELAQPLDMTLSAVDQHMQVLQRCGLVKTRKIGRSRSCQLDTHTLHAAEQWIAQRRLIMSDNLDRLGDYLDDAHSADNKETP